MDADLFAGLCAATLGLAVLFYFINLLAQKLPLRPLFIITSAFLFAMAITFIGEGVKSTGWVSANGIESDARGFIRATACDAVRAGNLFRCCNSRLPGDDKKAMHSAKSFP